MNSIPYSLTKPFSHIYVEEEAFSYPATQEILKKFPAAKLINIRSQQELFNRPRQDWTAQRQARKLILAVKKEGLLYPGVAVTPSFGNQNFFYNSPILNCIYDCEYCYLQGMYPSANIVLFVNSKDFLEAIDDKLKELGSAYVCISYDSDLLALDHLFPWTEIFLEFVRLRPNCLIELRTKSANSNILKKLRPANNFITAWTLSPDFVIKSFEHKTPSLKARLSAAKLSAEHGFPLRLCFDPILDIDQADIHYKKLVKECFSIIKPELVQDISIGSFRMNQTYFKNLKERRLDSKLVHDEYQKTATLVEYPAEKKSYLERILIEELRQFISLDKISTVQAHE